MSLADRYQENINEVLIDNLKSYVKIEKRKTKERVAHTWPSKNAHRTGLAAAARDVKRHIID
jgi:hypothetical protein